MNRRAKRLPVVGSLFVTIGDYPLNNVVPVQTDYFPQNDDGIQDDRIHARIFWLQTIVVVFFVESFAGRFIIVRHGYDDIAVFSRGLFSDDD